MFKFSSIALSVRLLTVSALIALSGCSATTAQSAPAQPTSQAHRASARPVPKIVRAWASAWNMGDAEGMARLFTADGVYEDFAFGARFQGQEGVAQWVTITSESIPDVRIDVIDAFRAGDRVAVKFVFNGTPRSLGPVPSTGKSFGVPAVSYFELRGNRIRQIGDYYNLAELLRQLGLPADALIPPAP